MFSALCYWSLPAKYDTLILYSYEIHIDFFHTKLFRTSNIETVKVSQSYFGISLPSVVLRNRIEKFELQYFGVA